MLDPSSVDASTFLSVYTILRYMYRRNAVAHAKEAPRWAIVRVVCSDRFSGRSGALCSNLSGKLIERLRRHPLTRQTLCHLYNSTDQSTMPSTKLSTVRIVSWLTGKLSLEGSLVYRKACRNKTLGDVQTHYYPYYYIRLLGRKLSEDQLLSIPYALGRLPSRLWASWVNSNPPKVSCSTKEYKPPQKKPI